MLKGKRQRDQSKYRGETETRAATKIVESWKKRRGRKPGQLLLE
jgi:hypothetical protein